MESHQSTRLNILIPAAESISNNKDLLFEIFLLLPTKSLLRFKCVSKHWLSLISSSQFTLLHTRHHHNNATNLTPAALLLNKAYTPTPEFQIIPLKQHDTACEVPFLDYLNVPRIKIRQSCNGLLLCSSSFLRKPSERNSIGIKLGVEDCSTSVVTQDDCGNRYFICNPTTKQFTILSFPSRGFKDSVAALNLAFDPFKSTCNCYYKVVSIRQVSDRFEIDVYSSETNSWNLLGINFKAPLGMRMNGSVFCNGKIHWYSKEVNVEYALYFDVDNECLKTMPMLQLPRTRFVNGNNRKIMYFGESRGYLHLIVTEQPFTLKFDVWEMAADYSGWHVRYHVNLNAAIGAFPYLSWPFSGCKEKFSVLCVIRAEQEEESVIVVFVDHTVISYNVHDGTSKKLCDLETKHKGFLEELNYEGQDAYQYFETLFCV